MSASLFVADLMLSQHILAEKSGQVERRVTHESVKACNLDRLRLRGVEVGNRGLSGLLSCAVVLGTSGCVAVKKELHHPGGYIGYNMDQYIFDASSDNHLQLLRYVFLASIIASVAEGTLTDPDDKDIFVRRMRVVTDKINYLAGDLHGVDTTKHPHCSSNEPEEKKCQSRPAMFQKNLPELNTALARMAAAGLPQRQASEIGNSITNANVLAVALKILKLGARAADGGHRLAATYRSSLETFRVALPSCRQSSIQDCLGTSDDGWIKIPNASLIGPNQAMAALPTFFDMMRQSCATVLDLSESGPDPKDERTIRCLEIAFKPALRFNGLRLTPPAAAPDRS